MQEGPPPIPADVVRALDELARVNNELGQLQRELARKNAALERLNEEKNRFLGMAAHDLRSPLSVIVTYARFLEEEAVQALGAEHRQFVSTIRHTAAGMLRLVGDLLDFAKIQAGTLDLQPAPVDLAELAGARARANSVLSAPMGVEISVQPAADRVVVVADAGRIEQVLDNLLSNAVKFSPAGSVVRVEIAPVAGGARLAVADSGAGIPAGDLAGLFAPFRRGRAPALRGERGTGLGLAIVKRIVDGHGGRIDVSSAVGAGTTVSVWLPTAGPAQGSPRAAVP